MTRFVIFAQIYVGLPVDRWFETISVVIGREKFLIDALLSGQVEGRIDRIESYNIGDLAEDVSEDIAIALGEPVRQRLAEDGYQLTDELRDFIETHGGLDVVIPAKRFEPAREYAS